MRPTKYIYLLKRVEHDKADLLIKQRLWRAERVEKWLHRYFSKSRFEMSRKVKMGKWLQAHVKIGISKDVEKRLRAVNNNFFKSGKTEWFAMHLLELLVVQLLLLWFAYRWWLLALLIGYIWYGNSL